jgi:intracellular multiplication protein IcmP
MSGGNNQGEPAFVLLMVVALFAGLGWVIWHASREFWLDYFFRWLRFSELWIINLFTHKYAACVDWLHYAPVRGQASPYVSNLTANCFGVAYLTQLPASEVPYYYQLSMPPVAILGAEAMNYFRWPLAAAFTAIGCHQLFLSPRHKFMTKHTLESLITTQAKMWPILSPIVKLNPSKTGRILGDAIPDVLPLFAEALSPEEWVSWNRIPVVNGIPDRDATRRAFVRQLGPRWNGMDSLPVHLRALLAAFALRGAQKRDESEELLGRLATCWSPEKGFQPDGKVKHDIDVALRDPAIGGKLVPITDAHAWRTTAILSALRFARANGGVLAPAQFLWLRAEDRPLWYPLNNLGRRSFHSEGAGAMAHFMAEEAAKKPLPIPRVDTAIVTLNTYLHDPDKRPVPIPPRASNSKA